MNLEKKNVIWNIIGATANAFNSLLFAIITTRINGITDAGIFSFAFSFACWFYVIGVYSGRVFQVTDKTSNSSDTDYIYNRIFTCIIMIICAVLFCIIKKYDIYKFGIITILCLFKVVEAFSESIYAVIQKNEQLYKVGISLFLKAVIAVTTFLIIDYVTKNLIISCISIVIVNILILIIYDISNIKKLKVVKTKFTKEANMNILKTGVFAFGLNFISIYLINASRYAIDDLLEADMQTIYGIILMPATFMGLLGQYIIQPAITKISNYIKTENYQKLKNVIIKLISIMFSFGIVVFIIAYLLEIPVLQTVYGVELKPYFTSAMVIIAGSVFYGTSIIISFTLIAMRKTLSQVIIYGICAIGSTIIAYKFVEVKQIMGASITYTITMIAVVVLFVFVLLNELMNYKKIGEK